jgi:hypothetical protein
MATAASQAKENQMSEQARAAAELIKAIAPLDTSEAARQFLNNEQYDNDKFALNLDKTESIIDAAITDATAELRAERDEWKAKWRDDLHAYARDREAIKADAASEVSAAKAREAEVRAERYALARKLAAVREKLQAAKRVGNYYEAIAECLKLLDQ